VGAPVRRKAPEKFFFGRATPLCGSKSTISRFGERFRDVQYSLVSFLFAVLLFTVPTLAQPFVKVGARAPVPHGVGAAGDITLHYLVIIGRHEFRLLFMRRWRIFVQQNWQPCLAAAAERHITSSVHCSSHRRQRLAASLI